MRYEREVTIIALILAAVCLLCVLYWVELYRRKCIEAEALRVALQYSPVSLRFTGMFSRPIVAAEGGSTAIKS